MRLSHHHRQADYYEYRTMADDFDSDPLAYLHNQTAALSQAVGGMYTAQQAQQAQRNWLTSINSRRQHLNRITPTSRILCACSFHTTGGPGSPWLFAA